MIIVALMAGLIFGYMMPRVKESIVNTKKNALEDIVNIAISNIDAVYREYTDKKITYDEAAAQAAGIVRNIRFGPEGKDYLWINNFEPRMIMHPFSTALEGKLLNEYKDASGKLMFMEFVDVCTRKGSGYVSYMWQWKDNKDLIVPKISYVKSYKPFGWIIGTGLYVRDVEAQIQNELDSLYKKLFVAIGVIVALTIIIILAFGKSIRHCISLMMNFSEKLAKGNLTSRIGLNQKDEFGMLSKKLNESVESFEVLIEKITLLSQNLVQAIHEIASGNENLSQRTTEQASSLETIAAAIEESMATLRQSSDNLEHANGISQKTVSLAEHGGIIVVEAIESIDAVHEASSRIEEIISVINEIAFQTNLLALNAAVEAARAGEMGRGFAVVAGEVRNLAQRSGAAAKEIGVLIQSTIEKVDKGTSLTRKSGDALKDIIHSVKEVGNQIQEIAAASEEQKSGSMHINASISELDQMTQQNAGLVEETASASEEISAQAGELITMLERFKTNVLH
jgi:methyl-accepting chemotaxis protein